MRMVRFVAIVCSLALLVGICYVCDSLLNEERAVVREYKSRLRQAVWSNDLTSIKVGYNDIVTDPEQIEQWLSVLKKIKVEYAPYQTVYGMPINVTFVYPEEEVTLGSYIATGKNEAYMYLFNFFSDNDYRLKITNWDDVGEELYILESAARENTLQNKAQ